jgi:YesN/AraC family two-component response regulator
VRQIGEAVGYPEQGYFSRIFKKYVGVSPLEYRSGTPES